MKNEVHEGEQDGQEEAECKIKELQFVQIGLSDYWGVGGVHDDGCPYDWRQVEGCLQQGLKNAVVCGSLSC